MDGLTMSRSTMQISGKCGNRGSCCTTFSQARTEPMSIVQVAEYGNHFGLRLLTDNHGNKEGVLPQYYLAYRSSKIGLVDTDGVDCNGLNP